MCVWQVESTQQHTAKLEGELKASREESRKLQLELDAAQQSLAQQVQQMALQKNQIGGVM